MNIVVGVDGRHPLFSALQQATSDAPDVAVQAKKTAVVNAPTDVLELPNGTLVITVDVPGPSRGDVIVGVERMPPPEPKKCKTIEVKGG